MTTEQIDIRIELFMEYLDYRLDSIAREATTKSIHEIYKSTGMIPFPSLDIIPLTISFNEWLYCKHEKIGIAHYKRYMRNSNTEL